MPAMTSNICEHDPLLWNYFFFALWHFFSLLQFPIFRGSLWNAVRDFITFLNIRLTLLLNITLSFSTVQYLILFLS